MQGVPFMKKVLLLVLLVSSWNAEAKEICTLAQTILKPAKNNRCYDQLIAKTKNVDDRKWLMNIRDQWKPAKGLQMNLLLGGFELQRGKKKVGKFQFISMNPLIMIWKDKLMIGKKSDEKSISKKILALLNDASTATYIYQSLFPSANAAPEGTSDEEQVNLTIMYSLGNDQAMMTAMDHMANKSSGSNNLPKSLHGEKISAQCTSLGVKDLKWPVKRGQQEKVINITQTGGNEDTGEIELQIKGVIDDVELASTYKFSEKFNPCLDVISEELDRKYCQDAWVEFFEKNPEIYKKFNASTDTGIASCDIFEDNVNKAWNMVFDEKRSIFTPELVACRRFFIRRFAAYSSTSDSSISVCADEPCTKKVSIDQYRFEKYRNFVGEDDKITCTPDGGCDLPSEVRLKIPYAKLQEALALQKATKEPAANNTVLKALKDDSTMIDIRRYAQGAALLSDCCKSEPCRKAALANRNIDLKAPETTPAGMANPTDK